MILPSNSPAKSFPNNTSSTFSIPLSQVFETPTKEKWKVGLVKIQVPMTFYNIEEGSEKIEFYLKDGTMTSLTIPAGVYHNPRTFAKWITKDGELLLLSYENGFKLKMQDSVRNIRITEKLSRLLGFPTTLENGRRWITSRIKHFDPWIDHRVLFVHSNLVRVSQVNSAQHQILQTLVPTKFNFGSTLSREYFPVDYHSVLGETHTVLSFKITDAEMRPIKFRSGNVILTLHFKRDA